MKTSHILLAAAVLYFVASGALGGGGNAPSATAMTGAAPRTPEPQPQSGGGDTFNNVLRLISATATAVGQGLALANDRNAQG